MTMTPVSKWHGTGNDFIVLDARGAGDAPYAEIARAVCHRRFSIGADGLLVLTEAHVRGADIAMRVFNPDGSEAQMCGNGVRCVSRYLHAEKSGREKLAIETNAGIVQTEIVSWQGEPGVRVLMGIPEVRQETRDRFFVVMGNPNIVCFTDKALNEFDLPRFAAEAVSAGAIVGGANVEIVRVENDGLHMRVHERGAGETWGCGTGACAVAAAAISSANAQSPVRVHSKGGFVDVEWEGSCFPAYLTGAAQLVYRTEVDLAAGVPVAPSV